MSRVESDYQEPSPKWLTVFLSLITIAFALSSVALIVYWQNLNSSAASFYKAERWRTEYLVGRLAAYKDMMPYFCGLSFLTLILHVLRRYVTGFLSNIERIFAISAVKYIFALIVVSAALVLGLYSSNQEWLRFGSPCWDGYCVYSKMIRDVLFTDCIDCSADLAKFMRDDYHANSPLVPLLTATLNALTNVALIDSYRALCGIATVATIFLVIRFSVTWADPFVKFLLVFLLASHMAIVRSFIFPQTDPFVLLWFTTVVILVSTHVRRPQLLTSIAIVLFLTTGLFIKLSFLPALAILPLWTVVSKLKEKQLRNISKGDVLKLVLAFTIRIIVFSMAPLMVYLSFQYKLDLFGNYRTEFTRITTEDSHWFFHLEALIKIVGTFVFPLVLVMLGGTRKKALILLCLVLYLVSLWGADTSGWMRFYLPIIPLLGVLSAEGLGMMAKFYGRPLAFCFVTICAFANYLAMSNGFYY